MGLWETTCAWFVTMHPGSFPTTSIAMGCTVNNPPMCLAQESSLVTNGVCNSCKIFKFESKTNSTRIYEKCTMKLPLLKLGQVQVPSLRPHLGNEMRASFYA